MTDYQRLGQVAQLQAERANAVAYDNTARVTAIDALVSGLGVAERAAEQRKAAAEPEPETAKRTAPVGRSQRHRQHG